MENNNYLSLLGLALRGGRLEIGADAVTALVHAKAARLIVIAQDASERTRRNGIHQAEVGQCLEITLPCTSEELGRSLGKKTVSVAALTDLGLAIALTSRLAAVSPEIYGETLKKLEIKSRRMEERKAKTRVKTPVKTFEKLKKSDESSNKKSNKKSDEKSKPRREFKRELKRELKNGEKVKPRGQFRRGEKSDDKLKRDEKFKSGDKLKRDEKFKSGDEFKSNKKFKSRRVLNHDKSERKNDKMNQRDKINYKMKRSGASYVKFHSNSRPGAKPPRSSSDGGKKRNP